MKNDESTQSSKYLGRGIHKEKMYNSLKEGNLKKMLNVISQSDDLDVQIRNNYLNIYYKGGCIAKIYSEKSVIFNEKYFDPYKENVNIKEKRKALTEKFKKSDYQGYFEEAKQIMDIWFKAHPKPERDEQQLLSIENKYTQSDYVIIDLEYQVSILSEFKCIYAPKGNNKVPRFDIVAVNKKGKLCVIELKKGTKALKGTSGLNEHWICYQKSIGRNHAPFIKEMQNLLGQKQEFGLVDRAVKILEPEPSFMFAYAYDEKTSQDLQDEEFCKVYKKIDHSPSTPIHVIKIKMGSHKLLD